MMQWFSLIALTITFALAARSLWKVEQVLSLSALLTSLMTFLRALSIAPAWGQLVIIVLLSTLYWMSGVFLAPYSRN